MGTRSLTKVYDRNGDIICCLYRQYDGYPDGHGAELKEYCKEMAIVNGISAGFAPKTHSNGMDEFAAKLVTHLKNDNLVGNIYLMPPDTFDVGEDFIYHIRQDAQNRIKVTYEDVYKGGEEHVL